MLAALRARRFSRRWISLTWRDLSGAIIPWVQFTDPDKRRHIYNSNAGVITGIDTRTGMMLVRLDAAAGIVGQEVSWSVADFQGFRHGYTGTIYKGQGKTLDHTYLLHSHHWRAAASYVALTRQRESAQMFVATETARNARQLAWQMARGEARAASIAWATADELAPALRPDARMAQRPEKDIQQASAPVVGTGAPPPAETAWLIRPMRARMGATVWDGTLCLRPSRPWSRPIRQCSVNERRVSTTCRAPIVTRSRHRRHWTPW